MRKKNVRRSRTKAIGRRASRCRVERLEPRLLLTATARDGLPYIDLGTSDNVAWDQPRVTIELLTDAAGTGTVGPFIFNQMLLDTGANTIITMATAVSEMDDPPYPYVVEGKFEELGVAGTQEFDISAPYRFDFAGNSGERETLLDTRIISDPVNDFSQFGPWGVIGMPTMVDRVTSLDFTVWETVTGLDLFMGVEFTDTVPESNGHRFSIELDNRLEFEPDHGVTEGCCPPVWGDVPFFTAAPMHNGTAAEGDFLFDTGAQVSVLSERLGLEIGLDSNGDGVLNENDANFARFETVGGIGGAISVPVFLFDEVHIPTTSGVDLVWTDLQWLVLDIVEGLDGVMGSDLLTSGWVEGFAQDGKSGWIDQVQMDFRNMNVDGTGIVHFDLNEQVDNLIDPNGAGARIIESGASTTVSEIGVDDSYQFSLTQQPTSNVTVTLSNPDNQLVAVDAANPANAFLVFTPSNWDQPQTVRVSALNDAIPEAFHRSSIFHVSSSSDPVYQGVGMPRVIANIIDDDFAGVMIIPTDGATEVEEGGAGDTYDLVLTLQPSEPVTISLLEGGNQISVVADDNPQSTFVVFTPANWNVPQTVRVTALDDSLNEGTHEAYVTHSIITEATEYQEAFALQEFVSIVDNDAGGIVVDAATGLTTTESGGEATFTLALEAEPAANVIIPLISTDTSEGTVSPSRVTFTPANWSTPQLVTVTGVNDSAVDGDVVYSIKTAAAISSDLIYSGLDAADVTLTNLDDDVAGLAVNSLIPTHNGFIALFNGDIDATDLNLYDTQTAGLGPADAVLRGQSVGDVAGSLVVDSSQRMVTFTKTGGPLESDSYTVTLRSATDGFKSASGGLLDGDGDGTPGDSFVESFNVLGSAANTVVVGVPDFVRGPGQQVHLPADSGTGIPLVLSNNGGIRAASLQLSYDPALLDITAATVAAGMPASATVELSTPVPGLAMITLSSLDDLPSGRSTIVELEAVVPTGAAEEIYSQQQILDVHAVFVTDATGNAVPAVDDDAVHLVSYFGDASGNGRINATDASLVARVSASIDSGFSASRLTDPRFVADISGNRRVNASDASLVARFAALHSVPEIPPIPTGTLGGSGNSSMVESSSAAIGSSGGVWRAAFVGGELATPDSPPPLRSGPEAGRVSLAAALSLQILGIADDGPLNEMWLHARGELEQDVFRSPSTMEVSPGDPQLLFERGALFSANSDPETQRSMAEQVPILELPPVQTVGQPAPNRQALVDRVMQGFSADESQLESTLVELSLDHDDLL